MRFKIEPYTGENKIYAAVYKSSGWSSWRYVTLFDTVDEAEKYIEDQKKMGSDPRIGKIY